MMNYNPIDRGSTEYTEKREALTEKVQANLSVFETDVTELERLWLIHDKNRTADPTMFEIGVSLWRTRRQSLLDRLHTYWSAEDSIGHEWVSYYKEQKEKRKSQPDRAISIAVLVFKKRHGALVKRCEELGFPDFLPVAVLSPAV